MTIEQIKILAEIAAAAISQKAQENGIDPADVAEHGLDQAARWALKGIAETCKAS